MKLACEISCPLRNVLRPSGPDLRVLYTFFIPSAIQSLKQFRNKNNYYYYYYYFIKINSMSYVYKRSTHIIWVFSKLVTNDRTMGVM